MPRRSGSGRPSISRIFSSWRAACWRRGGCPAPAPGADPLSDGGRVSGYERAAEAADRYPPPPSGWKPAPGKLFVVGDPKQSIYRFRGADVSVFGKTRKELLAEGGREVTLKANFRSDPRLVRFANGLFSRLMPSGPGEPDGYREAEARGRAGDDGPCVEYLACRARRSGPGEASGRRKPA